MAAPNGGIELLSMYNDEEEDDDDEEEEQDHQQEQRTMVVEEDDDSKTLIQRGSNDPLSESPDIRLQLSSLPNLTSHSPLPPPRGALAIVDYAHDEAAMSPEAEVGEIESSTGRVVISTEIHTSDGPVEERTPPGTVQLLTPSTQLEPAQPSALPDQANTETSMAIDSTGTEPEVAQVEVAAVVAEEEQKEDPLKSFLPPPLTTKCPEELQEKINKYLAYRKAGKSFNAALRNRKDYQNPYFLQHAVNYQEIDQMGTCFSKDVFDPHGYDSSDYFDEIEADMRLEMERKEQERKKSPKVDFVPGGTQPGTVAPVLKINAQLPVAGISTTANSRLQSISTIADATREIKLNKKKKGDEILVYR